MKKRLGILFVTLMMVFCFVACNSPVGGSSTDIVEGTWALTKGQAGDKEVSLEALQKAGIGGTTFTFTKGIVRITMTASEEVSEGKYTLEGDKVTISSDEEDISYTGTVKDDTLTITNGDENAEDEVKLIFERKK
ncbi:MAG: hypothetical protein II838_07400 [Lachnospiraceae bacterium]|nr:hypothetical protein [Lachnospiraceae bacterium]